MADIMTKYRILEDQFNDMYVQTARKIKQKRKMDKHVSRLKDKVKSKKALIQTLMTEITEQRMPKGMWIMTSEEIELEKGWTPFCVNAQASNDEETISRPRREAAQKSLAVTAAYVIDSEVEESTPPHLKSMRGVSPPEIHPGVEEAKRLLHVLSKNQKIVWPFEEPVENIIGYTEVIKRPMDLGTILTALREGHYNSRINQFVRDVRQVFINATVFNQPEHEVHRCAVQCSNLFEKKLAKSRILRAVLPVATIQEQKWKFPIRWKRATVEESMVWSQGGSNKDRNRFKNPFSRNIDQLIDIRK